MARLQGSGVWHEKRARDLIDQLDDEIVEAERARSCSRDFWMTLRYAETAGRVAANEEALEAKDFWGPDDEIMLEIDEAADRAKESLAESKDLCVRDELSNG